MLVWSGDTGDFHRLNRILIYLLIVSTPHVLCTNTVILLLTMSPTASANMTLSLFLASFLHRLYLNYIFYVSTFWALTNMFSNVDCSTAASSGEQAWDRRCDCSGLASGPRGPQVLRHQMVVQWYDWSTEYPRWWNWSSAGFLNLTNMQSSVLLRQASLQVMLISSKSSLRCAEGINWR